MVIIHELILDLKKNNTYVVQIPQYNKNTHRIIVTLTDDGQPFTIPSGFNAYFQMYGQGGNYWLKNATINNNTIQYTLLQSMVGGAGRHSAQIILSNDDTSNPQQISTFPFYIKVTDAVFSENTVVKAQQFDTLNNRLKTIDDKIDEVNDVINSVTTTNNYNLKNGSSTASLRQVSSIAESNYTIGAYAVALGSNTRASGVSSFAVNAGTIAASGSQTALGSYNIADNDNTYSLIIGNGVDADHRSNAVTVTWGGRVTANGSIVSEGGHFITNYNFVSHSTVTKGQNPLENTFRQFMIQDNTDGDVAEANRLAAFRSYVDTEGTSHIGIYAYKNEANSVSSAYIRISYPKSGDPGAYVSSDLRVGAGIGTGGKTAWNDTTNAGTWLTGNSGQIHLSSDTTDSGGSITFHYNKSAMGTSTISETESGTIKITGRLETSGRIANIHSDTSESTVKVQNSLHDGSLTASGSGLFCLYSVTNQHILIQDDTDGVVKVRCPNGMYRPVGTTDTDGSRVGAIMSTSATAVRVYGQKGTAGAGYSGYTLLTGTSDSDIRLKKNIKSTEINALPLLNAIEMKSFDWIPGRRDYIHQPLGMIADQIEKLDERLTIGGGYDPDGTPNYKVIDDHYMICYLTKGIQELTAENKELRERLEKLEKR